MRLAYLLLGDEGRARELVAETLSRYADRPAPDDRSPYPYARSLLVERLARPRLSRRSRQAPPATVAAPPPADPVEPPLPSAEELRRAEEADAAALVAAVLLLPVRTRLVVVLALHERLAAETIADDLGCTVRTVRREQDRALATLAALPVPAVLAALTDRSIEDRLTAALTDRAAQIDADIPIALAGPVGSGRGRRIALGAAAGLIIVSGAVWLRPQAPEAAEPRPTPTASGQTVLPTAPHDNVDVAWPIRGSLAGDRIFMAQLTRRVAGLNLGSLRILYAGDVRDQRIVITRDSDGSGPDGSVRSFQYLTGARGSAPEALSFTEGGAQDASLALAYVPHWTNPPWTLVLGPTTLERVELSDGPTYTLDGTPTRTYRSIDLAQGTAVAPTSARAPGLMIMRQQGTPDTLGHPKYVTPLAPAPEPILYDPSVFLPPGASLDDSDLTGDCTRNSSTVRMEIRRIDLPGVTEWATVDDDRIRAVFAIIRRPDGTAFRSVRVEGVPNDFRMPVTSCAPVPAAVADLLPYATQVNNAQAYLVILPRPHPEVVTAEIHESNAPASRLLGRATFHGQFALINLLNPSRNPQFTVVDPRTAAVILRDRRGRVLLTCPILRRWDLDPTALIDPSTVLVPVY